MLTTQERWLEAEVAAHAEREAAASAALEMLAEVHANAPSGDEQAW